MSAPGSHWEERMYPSSSMPRFYPPGQHPAMRREYEFLRRAREWEGRTGRSLNIAGAITYAEDKIASFEERESELKAQAYFALRDR